ncbi:MAG TPA: hypothetical protein VEC06_21475 [Paucimonas sp.]|nr:hypothetical protein [Paucimonas sp.]
MFWPFSGSILRKLARRRFSRARVRAVSAAIAEKGYWEERYEWRINTETEARIEPVRFLGRQFFQVSVKCDQEFLCRCPTIARAVEFLGVYEELAMATFEQLGWPSWASRTRLEP